MKSENIPPELTRLNQWVCVNAGSKAPMKSYEDAPASTTDPSTWSDFETAVYAVEHGYYDNIGFVFNNNGIVGIDIDIGFDNGILSDVSRDIMRACQSYTEKSRSGRGVHILVKGTLPFKGKNNLQGVEIYQCSRYFITTGQKLIFGSLEENQAGIDYVIAKYFPDAQKVSTGVFQQKIYCPVYPKPQNGRIALRPIYPPVPKGARNLSMTSLAGALHSQGYDKGIIFQELLFANNQACTPPLPRREIENIVTSVTRYRR